MFCVDKNGTLSDVALINVVESEETIDVRTSILSAFNETVRKLFVFNVETIRAFAVNELVKSDCDSRICVLRVVAVTRPVESVFVAKNPLNAVPELRNNVDMLRIETFDASIMPALIELAIIE